MGIDPHRLNIRVHKPLYDGDIPRYHPSCAVCGVRIAPYPLEAYTKNGDLLDYFCHKWAGKMGV